MKTTIIKERKINIDMLRTLSSFSIVLLHVSASYWSNTDINSNQFTLMTLYNGICRSAVPVFLMISGMFMIPKDIQGITLLKKALKLVGYFFFWSFFYATQSLAIKFILYKTITPEDFCSFIHELLFGHYHQWFLLMLAGIYLILPFIQKFCLDNKLVIYFIFLWLIFNFFSSLLPIGNFLSQLQMHFVIGYVGYFVLGYYLSHHTFKFKHRVFLYLIGIMATAYTIIATIVESRITSTYVTAYYGSFSLNILLMSIAIFVFFQNIEVTNAYIKIIFSNLGKASLIVYMLHPFFEEKNR